MTALPLSALLWPSVIGDKPLLRIEVDEKLNSTLTVISRMPWTLERSTDLVRWEMLAEGKPSAPGMVNIFSGIDYVWGHRTDRAFYRVTTRTALAKG